MSLAFSTVHEVLTTHIDAVADAGAYGDAVKVRVRCVLTTVRCLSETQVWRRVITVA